MAADWKTQAKTEYEAELYRQTHPYEQWIAENEAEDMEDMEDLPDGKSLKRLKAGAGSPKQSLGAELFHCDHHHRDIPVCIE